MLDTESPVRELVPMSPRTKWVSQSHHCWKIEWSSPSFTRCSASTRCESRWCRNFASGSIAFRISQKVMKDANNNTGIEPSSRRERYFNTECPRHRGWALVLDPPLFD